MVDEKLLKQAATEFIGTFIFLGVIVTVTNKDNVVTGIAPLAIGLALAVVIYWGGNLSGGAYNPAVSIMMAIKGTFTVTQAVVYIVVQILAAVCTYYYWKNVLVN